MRTLITALLFYQNSPAWVWFLGEDGVPEEIPKTASGKVQKHILREWSKELARKGIGRATRRNSVRLPIRAKTRSRARVRRASRTGQRVIAAGTEGPRSAGVPRGRKEVV